MVTGGCPHDLRNKAASAGWYDPGHDRGAWQGRSVLHGRHDGVPWNIYGVHVHFGDLWWGLQWWILVNILVMNDDWNWTRYLLPLSTSGRFEACERNIQRKFLGLIRGRASLYLCSSTSLPISCFSCLFRPIAIPIEQLRKIQKEIKRNRYRHFKRDPAHCFWKAGNGQLSTLRFVAPFPSLLCGGIMVEACKLAPLVTNTIWNQKILDGFERPNVGERTYWLLYDATWNMVSHILIMFNRMYENMSCNILQIEFHRLQEHTYHLVLEDGLSKDSFRLVCSRSYFNVFKMM